MCRPARWLPGLIPLFLIFLAAVGLKVPEIQHDLTVRTNAALSGDGLGAAPVNVSGRDVSLHGTALSTEGRGEAVATADGVNGVRLVNDHLTLLAIAKPFAFTARRDGDLITLSGSVPGPDARAQIVTAAKRIAPHVDDQLAFARGGAPQFEGWAKAALAPLARLSRGSSDLVDGALSVTGEAPDSASYQAALAASKALPAGLALKKADITAPVLSPYVWSAATDGKAVTLEGGAPSEEARAMVVGMAKAALPGLAIVDHMQIASGADRNFPAWTQAGMSTLGKLARGKAALSDAALTIAGEATSETSYRAALAVTKSLPMGLKLAGADILAPVQSPFVWSASSDGKSITLEGFVPSEEARASVLGAARAAAPGMAIVDHMRLARGAPENFAAASTAGLNALGRLASGKARLADSKLSMSGMTKAGETAESFAHTLAGALPAGVALAENSVRAPEQHPFVFSARKAADGAIAVSGFAPTEAARTAAFDAARRAGSGVSGDAAIASGLPAEIDFGVSTAFGLGALAELKSGEMILGEDGLTIRGVGDEAVVAKIRAQLASPPPGVRIRLADLTALTAPPQAAAPAAAARAFTSAEAACQKNLTDRMSARNIQFRTASADIERDSEGLIADLARILKSCPEAKVEVGGHTDNIGAPEMNKDLSLERAKSVVSALVAAGAAADRLTAAGYGDERPIATNATREGRAQNRRTEFVVK